jgi:hypothetical protein
MTIPNKTLREISEFHQHFQPNNVVIAFDGILSKEILSAVIERLKLDIDCSNTPKKEKKRFFSIVVECLQNLSKHGCVDKFNNDKFLLIVEREPQRLRISTGNLVSRKMAPSISQSINMVNSKSEDELSTLYRNGIIKNQLTEKGEAGLGFIDIARKSSSKLVYQFNDIDEENTFFLFQTEIKLQDS